MCFFGNFQKSCSFQNSQNHMTIPCTRRRFRASYRQYTLEILCGMDPSRSVGIKNMSGSTNRPTGRREPAFEKKCHEPPRAATSSHEIPNPAKGNLH